MDFRDIVKSWQLWLIFFGVILLSSIFMSFRKMMVTDVATSPPASTHPAEHMLELEGRAPAPGGIKEDFPTLPAGSFELGVVGAVPGSKGNATWIMHSYASTVKAGAELMAHEVSKFLQRAGWNVRVLLYDGVI